MQSSAGRPLPAPPRNLLCGTRGPRNSPAHNALQRSIGGDERLAHDGLRKAWLFLKAWSDSFSESGNREDACADLRKPGPADHILITDSRDLVGTSRDGPWRGFGETPGRRYERGGFGTSRDPLEVTGSQEVAPVGGLVPPGTFAHVGASGRDVTRDREIRTAHIAGSRMLPSRSWPVACRRSVRLGRFFSVV